MTRTTRLIAGFGLALAAGIAAPACTVRGSGYVGASTTPVVYQEPPQPQVETVSERPGYLWVHGRWDWQNGQWAWIGGHWDRERAGYAWTEGRWERRGNSWHWIDGTWAVSAGGGGGDSGPVVRDHDAGWQPNTQGPANGGAPPAGGGGPVVRDHDAGWQPNTHGPANGGAPAANGGMYPTQAPPPIRVESSGPPRAGFLFVAGRWDWRNGNWAWVPGHWERERANMTWVGGRWELQGNYYVWVEGRWDRAAPQPAGPVVRDHR